MEVGVAINQATGRKRLSAIEPTAPGPVTTPEPVIPPVAPSPPTPTGGMTPTTVTDPAPFDLDGHFNSWSAQHPIDQNADWKAKFHEPLSEFARPFAAQGYGAMAALNRGVAAFSAHLDAVGSYLEAHGVGERGGLFEMAAKEYEGNAEYWQKRAEAVGINVIDEVISSAAGQALPGTVTFALDMASGLTFPYAAGATGPTPVASGLLKAAETGVLGGLFKMMAPLKQYLKIPAMGTVFGIQESAQTPEDQKAKAFIKGAATGALYAATSPGGRLGLNDVIKGIEAGLPGLMRGETGAIGKDVKPAPEFLEGPARGEAEVAVRKLAKENNTFKYSKGDTTQGYGRRQGYPQPVGTPVEKLFSNMEEGPRFQEQMFERANKDIPYGDKSYFDSLPSGGVVIVTPVKAGGTTRVQIVKEGVVVAAARLERGMIDSIAARPGFEKQGVGTEMLSYIQNENLANIAEIPDRSPGMVALQKKVLSTPPSAGPPPNIQIPQQPTPPPGAPPIEPTGPTSQRKFLKTVAESDASTPELKAAAKAIKPQEAPILRNKEQLAKANVAIDTEGLDAVRERFLANTPFDSTKSHEGIALLKRYQKLGDGDRATEVLESYTTQVRGAGQGAQAASLWAELTPSHFIRWGNKQLDRISDRYGILDKLTGRKPTSFELTKEEKAEILDLHRRANELPDGPDKADLSLQMIDIVARKVPPSWSEWIDAFRYQNMLSSPRSWLMRNPGENMFNTVITRPMDLMAQGAVDFVKSGLTGKARQQYVSDALVYEKAVLNSFPNGFRVFMDAWNKGGVEAKPDTGYEGKTAFDKARADQLPDSLTAVSRLMTAADAFSQSQIMAGEMAWRLKNGQDPTGAVHEARQIAEEKLYRAPLDPHTPNLAYPSQALAWFGQVLESTRKGPLFVKLPSKLLLPFISTPINKAIQGIEYSPLTLLRNPKQFAETEVAAKLLTASIIQGVAGTLAYLNETTWTAPSDEEGKALFYTHKRQFSVKIGDAYIPVWYLGPYFLSFAFPMAVKHYFFQRPETVTDSMLEKITALSQGLAQMTASQTSSQSAGALFEALQGNIDSNWVNQLSFSAQQFIPFSAGIRFINTMIDKVYRRPDGFWEGIEANLPGLSTEIEARKLPYPYDTQDAVRNPLNYALPYDIGKADKRFTKLAREQEMQARMNHLDNKFEALNRKWRDDKITDDEFYAEFDRLQQSEPKAYKEPMK